MSDIKFEDALQRIERIVDELEAGNLGLEESLKVFEEGVGLARRCAKALDEAEKRIELLTRDAGGKRLRPVLVIAGAEAVGGRMNDVMPTACALELIHTYSLVHDDLPAMDDDDFRRGAPTNHKMFGEAMAILAGDALLTLAFRLVADNVGPGMDAARLRDVLADIADAAGHAGMVGGQVADP